MGINYHFLSLWYDLTWDEPQSPRPLANFFFDITMYTILCSLKKKLLHFGFGFGFGFGCGLVVVWFWFWLWLWFGFGCGFGFGLVLVLVVVWFWLWFYGTSTIVGHSVPNPFYSKVGDLSRGWPGGSFFNSYNTEVKRRVLLHSLDWSTLPLIHILWYWVLSTAVSGTIFWVFGIIQSEIEPLSPRPLVNILLIRPMPWISKHILLITFLNEPKLIFCRQLNGFTYFYLIQIHS